MSRAFGSPLKYIQRAGEMDAMLSHLQPMGSRAFFLVDRAVFDWLQPRIALALGDKLRPVFEVFGGECSRAEIDRVSRLARGCQSDIIVGLGGGKAIDCAKVAASETGARLVVVPTIASSDAPCSAVAVLYTANGLYERSYRLERNPDLVLVDSAVIVAAPKRFLVAGMGDALSTWFEARSNLESRTKNYVAGGFPPTQAGIAIARRCHDVLMQDGLKATMAAERGLLTTAVENVIEANTLLSGIGFENVGCSAAHGLHGGLTALEETRGLLHGEKVAFGTLCLLMLENRPLDEITETVRFCAELGLPTKLSDLGLSGDDADKITRIAEASLIAGESTYATHVELSPAIVRDAMLAVDALVRRLPSLTARSGNGMIPDGLARAGESG